MVQVPVPAGPLRPAQTGGRPQPGPNRVGQGVDSLHGGTADAGPTTREDEKMARVTRQQSTSQAKSEDLKWMQAVMVLVAVGMIVGALMGT